MRRSAFLLGFLSSFAAAACGGGEGGSGADVQAVALDSAAPDAEADAASEPMDDTAPAETDGPPAAGDTAAPDSGEGDDVAATSDAADASAEDAFADGSGDASGPEDAAPDVPACPEPPPLSVAPGSWQPSCPPLDSGAVTLASAAGPITAFAMANGGSTLAIAWAEPAPEGGEHLRVLVADANTGVLIAEPLALLSSDPRPNRDIALTAQGQTFALLWSEAEGELLDPGGSADLFFARVGQAGDLLVAPVQVGTGARALPFLVPAKDGGLRAVAIARFDDPEVPSTIVALMYKLTAEGEQESNHFVVNAEDLEYLGTHADGESLMVPFVKAEGEPWQLQYFLTEVTNPVCSLPTVSGITLAPGGEVLATSFGDTSLLSLVRPPAACGGPPVLGGMDLLSGETWETSTPDVHFATLAPAAGGRVLLAVADTDEQWELRSLPVSPVAPHLGAPRVVFTEAGAAPALPVQLATFKLSLVRAAWVPADGLSIRYRALCPP